MAGVLGAPEAAAGAEAAPPVNGYDVLEKVLALPVSTWHYKADPPGVRHLGPMAQDWRAAFGLGSTDTRIWCVDANGVAIVSIQALHQLIADLQSQIAELRAEVEQLQLATPES